MAPEVLYNRSFKWSEKQDVYSLGVVLYSLLHDGAMPFPGIYEFEVKKAIENHTFKIRKGLTESIAQILVGCLMEDASQRLTIAELIALVEKAENCQEEGSNEEDQCEEEPRINEATLRNDRPFATTDVRLLVESNPTSKNPSKDSTYNSDDQLVI